MQVWRVVVFCAALLGVNGLRINRIEAPGDVVEGDTVTLRCEYDLEGGNIYSVKWYHNNVQFYLYRPDDGNWAFPEKDMKIDLDASDDKQVTLKNVTKILSGKYKCEISLDAPQVTTETASLLLNISKGSAIKNLKMVLPQNVRAGDQTAVLECTYELDNVHLDKVIWLKDSAEFYTFQPGHPPIKQSKPLPGITVDLAASNGKQLVLNNIKTDTAGNYRCQVITDTQPPQSLTAQGELIVLKPKESAIKNLKMVLPQNVRVGDQTAVLECTYELNNAHLDKVIWLKDSAEFYTFQPGHPPIKQSKPLPGIRVDLAESNGTHVVLYNINVDTTGNYRCQVITDTQPPESLIADGELTVMNPRVPELQIPTVFTPSDVHIGDRTATLHCNYDIKGEKLSTLKWYKDNNEIYRLIPAASPQQYIFPQRGVNVDIIASDDKKLILKYITEDTAGLYHCQVETEAPNSLNLQAQQVRLNVEGPQTWRNPKILLPDNVHAGNKSITLQCDYDLPGSKLYMIKWYKNDNEFYRFTSSETPQKQAFPLQGINVDMTASDDKHLTLTDITKDTAGLYRCEISSDAPLFLHLETKAELNVLDAVEKGNFFNRAFNWFRDKWNDIKPK